MARTEQVTCDQCGSDLSETVNNRWRLALIQEPIPNNSNRQTLEHRPPMLPHSLYFCDRECLRHWAMGKRKPPGQSSNTYTVQLGDIRLPHERLNGVIDTRE